jgi:hypothetical protein
MSAHFHLILCISSRPGRFATGRTILSPMRTETNTFQPRYGSVKATTASPAVVS